MSLTGTASTGQFGPPSSEWRAPDTQVVANERQKISRDIHDSAIQPYIGLKLALEALSRKVPPDHPLSKDITRLVEMTSMEIAGLRRYIKGLKGQLGPARETLGSVLQLKAARFAELYGIKVSVDVTEEAEVDDALAEEISHILGEALSNIRRHTNAAFARVKFSCDARQLALEIINPRDRGVALNMFTPRSITERAVALGGRCSVETGSGRYTVITVEIPQRS
jgi:signal transduction histidine kinase